MHAIMAVVILLDRYTFFETIDDHILLQRCCPLINQRDDRCIKLMFYAEHWGIPFIKNRIMGLKGLAKPGAVRIKIGTVLVLLVNAVSKW